MVGDDAARGGLGETRLSVVVVGYRQPELLTRAVSALHGGSYVPDEVVVVDVAPAVAWEPAWGASVVALDGNPGYAAACARGVDETSGDWLLFMNADVTVAADTIEHTLREATADTTIGIATCRLTLPDGTLDHACHRGSPSLFDSLAYKSRLDRTGLASRRLGRYRMTWLDPTGSHDVEACSGAFLMIRRAAYDGVGGWDEAYRFYGEDLDLCARVRRAGWRVRYVGGTCADHDKGAASHLRRRPASLTAEERETRLWVQRSVVDAHERFYEQHMESGTARLLRPLVRGNFALQRWRLNRRDG